MWAFVVQSFFGLSGFYGWNLQRIFEEQPIGRESWDQVRGKLFDTWLTEQPLAPLLSGVSSYTGRRSGSQAWHTGVLWWGHNQAHSWTQLCSGYCSVPPHLLIWHQECVSHWWTGFFNHTRSLRELVHASQRSFDGIRQDGPEFGHTKLTIQV